MMNRLLLIFILIWLAASSVVAQTAIPVAWIDLADGTLWIASDSSTPPQAVQASGVSSAVWSPNGQYIAYIDASNTPHQVIVINPDTPEESIIQTMIDPDEPILGYLTWQGNDALWVNTFFQNTPQSLIETNWSLWRLALADGTLQPVGQGRAYPHPTDGQVAVIDSGRYPDEAGQIQILDAVLNPTLTESFAAVGNASHLGWVPRMVVWRGETLRMVLPDPDVLYRETSLSIVDYTPSIGGQVVAQLDVRFNVFGGVQWSPDGEWFAYTTLSDDLTQQHIDVVSVDSQIPQRLVENISTVQWIMWRDALTLVTAEQLYTWTPETGLVSFDTPIQSAAQMSDGAIVVLTLERQVGILSGETITIITDTTPTSSLVGVNP